MRKDFRRIPGPTFDVVMKCWDLYSPTDDLLSRHCGEHTEIVRCCIESPNFKTILDQCRTSVEMLWQHQDGIEVLCVCNEGKHQSVAVSAALQAIYQMDGFSSGGPYHLSNTHWWRRLCSACSQCKANEDKDTLFRACVDTRLMVI